MLEAAPINLLLCDLNAARIEAILARHPRRPLVPPLGSPEWERAAANPHIGRFMQPLRALAEKQAEEPLPALTDELYESFGRTGIRLPFEAVYFERRRRLASAAMSLLLCRVDDPWRDRLQTSLIEKFTAIFEEVSWALPAHVHWDDDDKSGKDPLQIDLFCAETANLMGEMLDLFGTILPEPLHTRVRERLRTAVFENYLARPFHWKEITNNWNAVCHQGVIGAALAVCDDPALLARMLVEMRRWLPRFLDGFGPDGGCSEGPGYWCYGFGWFAALNEQLETRAGLSLFEGDEKIHKMARYGQQVALKGGNLVNFADAPSHDYLRPALMGYLARRLPGPGIAAAAAEAYRQRLSTPVGHSERDDLFQFARMFLYCPEDLSISAAETEDCFFPNLAILVARGTDRSGRTWEFAAKAGHNDEHHNHNDCGSFILNVEGISMISEIGFPEYDRGYFSPARYDYLAARTRGHSLPVINGCEQRAGADAASIVLSHELSPGHAGFAVDATKCYPVETGCTRFVRRFQFDKLGGKLRVDDHFELTRLEALETALISFLPITIVDAGLALIETESLRLAIRPSPGTRLLRVEALSFRGHYGNEDHVFRLALGPEMLRSQVEIGIGIELL